MSRQNTLSGFVGLLCSLLALSVAGQSSDGLKARDAALRRCFEGARRTQPDLSVDATATILARGQRIVYAEIEPLVAPELEQCFTAALMQHSVTPALTSVDPNALSIGGIALRFGLPAGSPPRRPSLREVRAMLERFKQHVLERGLLRPNDALYREWLSPPPPWPGPGERAELEACYRAALPAHPGLVLHRSVLFLQRDGRVLLTDVLIPEAPELARCVTERVAGWRGPITQSEGGGSVFSSFFLDLGAPPEYPDALPADDFFKRRRALIERAHSAGLLPDDDPFWATFGQRGSEGAEPRR